MDWNRNENKELRFEEQKPQEAKAKEVKSGRIRAAEL